jgi:hypothetical protein
MYFESITNGGSATPKSTMGAAKPSIFANLVVRLPLNQLLGVAERLRGQRNVSFTPGPSLLGVGLAAQCSSQLPLLLQFQWHCYYHNKWINGKTKTI